MKQTVLRHSMALAGLSLGLINPAHAHVCNVDLSNPVVPTTCDAGTYHPVVAADGTVSIIEDGSTGDANGDILAGHGPNQFEARGWLAGKDAVLGNTHLLAGGDFFTFTLDHYADVTIIFSADKTSTGLDPAFSLYSGTLPTDAHDDALYDQLNPASGASATDKKPGVNPTYTAHDGYRDTEKFTQTGGALFVGQFDALANWSMANETANPADATTIPGNWSKIYFLEAVNNHHKAGVSEKLQNKRLQPGKYTIAAGDGGSVNVGSFSGKISIKVHYVKK